jgi:hypothetical protein
VQQQINLTLLMTAVMDLMVVKKYLNRATCVVGVLELFE